VNATLKLGEHVIYELSHCDRELLFDSERARDLFFRDVRASGLTVISQGFHQFSPHGFTCYLLLAESHASLHAWPEYGYCAIDVFTCNLGFDLAPLLENLRRDFGAQSAVINRVDRMAVKSMTEVPG
jgi:S-adenosylmethionine decarboxylase